MWHFILWLQEVQNKSLAFGNMEQSLGEQGDFFKILSLAFPNVFSKDSCNKKFKALACVENYFQLV